MKKSKFLKKSLAMLLALMLVVAMIPLSASASALPNLTKLYIDGKATDVNGTTFAGEVKFDSSQVELKVAAGSLGTADGPATLSVIKENVSDSFPINESGNPLMDLKKWGTETDDSWTLTLQLLGNDKDQADAQIFTVVLAKVEYGTTASLDPDVKEAGTGVYTVAINNADHVVDIEVPKGVFNGRREATFTVAPQDNASIESGTASATNNGDGTYNISVTKDDQTFTITSESKKNVATYTVNVTEKNGLNSFAMGKYEGKIDQDNETVTVEVDKADLYNEFGKMLSSLSLKLEYETYHLQSTVKIGTANYFTGDTFTMTVPTNVLTSNQIYTGKIALTCAGVANVQRYTLNVKVKTSSNTAITYAQFDDEISDVAEDNISAVLPVVKADGKQTRLTAVKVTLRTSTYEEIKSISYTKANNVGANFKKDGTNGSDDVWTASLDLSTDKLITVAAEDGTTQIYTLSASLAEDKETAYLDAIYLSGDGYKSEGNINGNTITFKVPYMTLNVAEWKVYATPNSSARVTASNNGGTTSTAVVNGTSTAAVMGLGNLAVTTTKVKKAISAVNKNDSSVFQTYDVVVELITPAQMGKTLTDLEISIQNVNPASGQTNAEVMSRVNPYNTIKASETISITDKGKATNNTGTITLKPAKSLSGATDIWDDDLYAIITEIETANGGVAFFAQKSNYGYMVNAIKLNSLVENSSTFDDDFGLEGFDLADLNTVAKNYRIVVLPEDKARDVLVRNTGAILPDEFATGTEYSFKVSAQTANPDATISNISVKDNALKVENSTTITGELAYGVTAGGPGETAKGTFMDFELSPHARVQGSWRSGTAGTGYIRAGGDTDGDGEANVVGEDNWSLLFVRDNDHKVNVFVNSLDINPSYVPLTGNKLTVIAENGSKKTYTFDLTWADPNTEAEFTSFSIGNSTGRISGDKIDVVVPYGTDLTGLIPTFTTSTGATVTLSDTSVISGKTFVNFSRPVQLLVTSEDGKKTNPYTVTVKTSEAFTDVQPGAWYYDNVMQAAAAGIVSGRGDGTFAPLANVTRRDFAIMLTQMMGISNDGTAVSPFIDVEDDDYGVVAIDYCSAHGIVSGYTDGTFQPNKTITRQEAASMIVKAMGVSKASEELYPDDSTIAGWAKDAVYKAKAAGLMKGDAGTGNFRPTATITRAEAASIMVNALNQ